MRSYGFGHCRYLVDYKWMEAWKDYVNYNSSASNTRRGSPGPIDNGEILAETGNMSTILCLSFLALVIHFYNRNMLRLFSGIDVDLGVLGWEISEAGCTNDYSVVLHKASIMGIIIHLLLIHVCFMYRYCTGPLVA